jgi:hypothetical protein
VCKFRRDRADLGLWMRPPGSCDTTRAVAVAAPNTADYRFLRIRISRIVTVMGGLPPAAGMLWRGRSLQRGRKNRSDKRE